MVTHSKVLRTIQSRLWPEVRVEAPRPFRAGEVVDTPADLGDHISQVLRSSGVGQGGQADREKLAAFLAAASTAFGIAIPVPDMPMEQQRPDSGNGATSEDTDLAVGDDSGDHSLVID